MSAEKSDLASQLRRMEDSQCEMCVLLDVLSVEKTDLLHQMVVFKCKKAVIGITVYYSQATNIIP